MKIFIINGDNQVCVYQLEAVPTNVGQEGSTFRDEDELESLAANWPSARLVCIWNNLPGVVGVKKFTDRRAGVHRIWKAIQELTPLSAPHEPVPQSERPKARENSKKAQVLKMLGRPEGTTVQQIMAATGWQAHTVRGFLSGTVGKRMGLLVTSQRHDGERVYRLAAGPQGQ